jgi:hypothetical protein
MAAILSPLSIYGDSLKTKIPLKPTKGTLGIWLSSTIRRMPGDHPMCSLDASLVIPTCVFRFEASRRAQISSPPVKHPVLVLWLNQVTRQFYGELSQTPRAESGSEPLPYTSSCPRLRLAFIATMRPALDPASHRSLTPSLLVSPVLEGPGRHRPFVPALHLHEHRSSRDLHL